MIRSIFGSRFAGPSGRCGLRRWVRASASASVCSSPVRSRYDAARRFPANPRKVATRSIEEGLRQAALTLPLGKVRPWRHERID